MLRGQSKKAREAMKKKYELMSHAGPKKKPEMSQDTIDRKNLQDFIEKSIVEGYDDEDIKVVLEKKYPKYAEFIPIWISNKRRQFSSSKSGRDDK